MKFRKKPVIIEAVQITSAWFDDDHPNPLHPLGVIIDPKGRCVIIKTLNRFIVGKVGDWITTNIKGEKKLIYSDFFEQTYEKVE